MARGRLTLACAAALAAALVPAAASAHASSISYSELRVDGAQVRGELRFSLADLQTQGPVDPARLDLAALRPLALDPFVVSQEGKPCPLDAGASAKMDGPDGVLLEASWTCPTAVSTFAVRAGFIETLPLGHTHLARVLLGDGQVSQRVAQSDAPGFEVTVHGSGGSSGALRFAALGALHALTGGEHLAFLLLLVVLGGALREHARAVTGFTLFHSATLVFAALAPLDLPPRALDAALAATVLAAALDLRPRALERRFAFACVLGAVHGLGFSSVLPRASLAAAMPPFSLGLWGAQLALIALALPLCARGPRWIPRAGAAAAAVLALAWLLLRLRA